MNIYFIFNNYFEFNRNKYCIIEILFLSLRNIFHLKIMESGESRYLVILIGRLRN